LSGAVGAIHPPDKSKAVWMANAASWLKECFPEVKGVIWFSGAPGNWWLDRAPEGSPAAIKAFAAWAADPYFNP
jgi:hypothetical protein